MRLFNRLFGKRKPSGCAVHNCQEIASKFMLILDKELSEEEEKRLIEDIKRCPACLEHFNLDKAYKEYMRLKVDKKCCSKEVLASIKQTIASQAR